MSVYSTHVAVIILYTCVVPRVRGNCNREVLLNDMYLKTLDSGEILRFSAFDDLQKSMINIHPLLLIEPVRDMLLELKRKKWELKVLQQ